MLQTLIAALRWTDGIALDCDPACTCCALLVAASIAQHDTSSCCDGSFFQQIEEQKLYETSPHLQMCQ
jgi:hypothetical protein